MTHGIAHGDRFRNQLGQEWQVVALDGEWVKISPVIKKVVYNTYTVRRKILMRGPKARKFPTIRVPVVDADVRRALGLPVRPLDGIGLGHFSGILDNAEPD